MRRIFSLILVLCLLSVFLIPANATTEKYLEDAILEACIYLQEADLSDYSITADAFEKQFDEMYISGALPWYTSGSYDYTYDTGDNTILSFTPSAIYDGNIDMLAYEQKIAEILEACVLPGMTDTQIALALHDYIAVNATYDETLEKNTGYDLIVNGSSVCAGYAEAYQDLLIRAGIPCMYVSSDEMDHGWNLVSIDGNWYHVDLTWDDPTPDVAGRVLHDYFLLTDEEISAGEDPHYGWEATVSCTDTRFSDGWWRNVNSQVIYADKDSCYLLRTDDLRNALYLRIEHTGEEQLLYEEKDHYINIGHGSYRYEHQGLILRNGKLYFNTMDAIQYIDLATNEIKAEYVLGGNHYISGFSTTADALILSLMDHDSNITTDTQPMEPSEEHIHSYFHMVKDPTCCAEGYTTSVCTCGSTFQSTPVATTPHDMTVSKESSDIIYTCKYCGYSRRETVPSDNFEFPTTPIVICLILILIRIVTRKKREY